MPSCSGGRGTSVVAGVGRGAERTGAFGVANIGKGVGGGIAPDGSEASLSRKGASAVGAAVEAWEVAESATMVVPGSTFMPSWKWNTKWISSATAA